MAEVMSLLNNSIVAASDWFVRIFNASGMVEIYLAFLFIIFAMRFILKPILGNAGSDRARKKTTQSDGDVSE